MPDRKSGPLIIGGGDRGQRARGAILVPLPRVSPGASGLRRGRRREVARAGRRQSGRGCELKENRVGKSAKASICSVRGARRGARARAVIRRRRLGRGTCTSGARDVVVGGAPRTHAALGGGRRWAWRSRGWRRARGGETRGGFGGSRGQTRRRALALSATAAASLFVPASGNDSGTPRVHHPRSRPRGATRLVVVEHDGVACFGGVGAED